MRRRPFLRREASRFKNFENSLYAETRKDTLTKSEDISGISIVGLEADPRSASVSYSVGLQKLHSVDNSVEFDHMDHETTEQIDSAAHNFEGFDVSAYNTGGFDFSAYSTGECETLAYNPTEFNVATRNFEVFDDADVSTA